MILDVFRPAGPAVSRDVGTAREYRPGNVGYSPDNERLVFRCALTDCQIRLSLAEVDEIFGHQEFDSQARKAFVEFVEQARFHQAIGSGRRTRNSNGTDKIRVAGRNSTFEIRHRDLDAFRQRTHFFSKVGEPVPGRMSLDKAASE